MSKTKIRVPRGCDVIPKGTRLIETDEYYDGHLRGWYRTGFAGSISGKSPANAQIYIRRRTRKKGGGK